MINKILLCINGKYYGPIESLSSAPTPGKKIMVGEEALTIRCSVRYIDTKEDIVNLYMDLIEGGKR